MTTIDFAFLADYATVDAGNLTAVGVGRRAIALPDFLRDQTHDIFIAGRAVSRAEDKDRTLVFGITSPDKSLNMSMEAPVSDQNLSEAPSVEAVFAFRAPIPMRVEGDYTFSISCGGSLLKSMTLTISFIKDETFTDIAPE